MDRAHFEKIGVVISAANHTLLSTHYNGAANQPTGKPCFAS